MSYRIITNTLINQLKTVENLPELFRENEDGALRSDSDNSSRFTRYCRTTLLPNPTVEQTIGEQGFNLWSGLLQVDLFYPTGDGTDGSDLMIDRIVDAFPQNNFLETEFDWNVKVRTVSRAVSFQSSNHYMVPVVINFECYIPR